MITIQAAWHKFAAAETPVDGDLNSLGHLGHRPPGRGSELDAAAEANLRGGAGPLNRAGYAMRSFRAARARASDGDMDSMRIDEVNETEAPDPAERHYTPAEISALWKIHVETVRRMFAHEPGVVVIQAPTRRGKREYRTLRILAGVLDRVHRRLQTR